MRRAAAPLLTPWHTAFPLLKHCSALMQVFWWYWLCRLVMPGLVQLWRNPVLHSDVQIPEVQEKFL